MQDSGFVKTTDIFLSKMSDLMNEEIVESEDIKAEWWIAAFLISLLIDYYIYIGIKGALRWLQ